MCRRVKLKPITELDENEAAAIAGYEFHAEIQGSDTPRKAVTVKFKFLDRLTALALIGKACHWYPGSARTRPADSDQHGRKFCASFHISRGSLSPHSKRLLN